MAAGKEVARSLHAHLASLHQPKRKPVNAESCLAPHELEARIRAEVDSRILWCSLSQDKLLTFPSVCLHNPRKLGATGYGEECLSRSQFSKCAAMPPRTMFSVHESTIAIVHGLLRTKGFDITKWNSWGNEEYAGYSIPF